MIPKCRGRVNENNTLPDNVKVGNWVYGYYAYSHETDKHYILVPNLIGSVLFDMFEVDGDTVGMFTGLTDKNGVDIYDGDYNQDYDVVKWCQDKIGWALAVYDFPAKEFVLCHCSNCEGDFDIDDDLKNFEIIGNIYETKGE